METSPKPDGDISMISRLKGKIFGNSEQLSAKQNFTPLDIKNGELSGVVTDQKLLTMYYKQRGIDAQAIATDSFLDKSRNEYNSAWLTRELVQNFVDHNPSNPGTLDGVKFSEKSLADGKSRFQIEGSWPFEDPTGVLSPHSEKPENRNTAGGNGIGLKQTAIRLLRDFGVQKFAIEGEGWTVNYRLAKSAEVNNNLNDNSSPYQVRHDWLLADISKTHSSGKNAYVIETDNPDIVKALQQLPTLGVSAENPYLQKMDYKNEFGAIKWLPKSETSEPIRGHLFINGQIMNYKDKGETPEDYWRGPESVTIQLNNLKYKMNIDRPPVTSFDLGNYLDEMVSAMPKEDILDQLKNSEHLWAGERDSGYSYDKQGALVLIKKLVWQLPYKEYDKKEFSKYFGDKKYVYGDYRMSEAQTKELEKQGYIICPSYFEQIGMARANSKLGSIEAASNETPFVAQIKREQFAQEYGMEVAYEDFSNIKESSEFVNIIGSRLAPQILDVERNEKNPNIVKIKFKENIPKDLLFSSLQRPKNEDQKLLHTLRSMAAYGLENKLFSKIFTSQGDFVTTFGMEHNFSTNEQILLARNIKSESDQGSFVEIELTDQYSQSFFDFFRKSTQPLSVIPEKITGADLIKAAKNSQQQQFANIPVSQPEAPPLVDKKTVILKKASISDDEIVRIKQMENQLPGIYEMVHKLEEVIPESKLDTNNKDPIFDKYLRWRQSDQFYGQLGNEAGYLTGRHLLELVHEQNQADISIVEVENNLSTESKPIDTLKNKLNKLAKRMNSVEDSVNDFDIIPSPNEKQLAQLGLLRLYTQLTTNVAIPNDLFLYEGTGSKGINLGQKAIGMHSSLLNTQFSEAMSTFVHEMAHNKDMNHENEFRHTMQSLFVTIIDRVSIIANKSKAGESLTAEDQTILDIQNEWDKIRFSEN